jgi:hypothetical protein
MPFPLLLPVCNLPRSFWLVVGLFASVMLLLPAAAGGRPPLPSQSDQVLIAAASSEKHIQVRSDWQELDSYQ